MRLTLVGVVLALGSRAAAAAPLPVVPKRETPAKISVSDRTAKGSMRALARAIADRFTATRGNVPFHRTAIPYFKEASANAQREQVGKLLAELLSVELAHQSKFVIVERERLDGLMREHRLADLGVVDEGTAAAFGKVLGAESLILGTVTESGAVYQVTVRQVDAQTGAVIVSAQIEVERAGLIALSSDAIETRSRAGAIVRSLIVPGWGQIYNKEPIKGGIFLSAALAAVATSAGFIIASLLAKNQYDRNIPQTVGDRDIANRWALGANISLGALAGIWALSWIDAAINGKDYSTFNVRTDAPAGAY